MRITTYFINFNDSFYIPFIAKHYYFSKIVMYDNYSTDDSVQIARSLGIEVRQFGQRGQLNDQHYLDVKNNCWKEERGKSNYVIVIDADEFLVLPESLTASCPIVEGYNMISEQLPLNTITELTTGAFDENYSKQAIFDPNRITEINYVHGCHKNHKIGEITTEGEHVKLLHYRMIGGVERIIKRHQEYRLRLSAFNLKFNMGHHYHVSEEQKKVEWEYYKSNAKEIW